MGDYHFKRSGQKESGDRFFKITAGNFPCLKSLSIQDLDMEPGEARHAHMHPNANQMDYVVSGRGRVGIVGPSGDHHILDLEEGDAAFIPRGYLHWIQNAGEGRSRFILLVSHEAPETIELADMVEATPADVAMKTRA